MSYQRYHDAVETPYPGEAEFVKQTVESMGRVNERVYRKHRHGLRDAHAKSHGILKGELRVHAGLPEHLAQGLFAEARTYPVIVRFSTAPGDLTSDQVPTARGMAIKVLGVGGERALDDGASTQDFLLVNSPTLPFGDVEKYHKLQQALEKQSEHPAPEGLAKAVAGGARVVAEVLRRAGQEPPVAVELLSSENHHILGETFHSMAALRYGDYIAKISAAPASAQVQRLTGTPLSSGDPSALSDMVHEFFAAHAADYDLRVQLCRDLARMPVEDAAVLWREDEAPLDVVATLHLPAQDSYSPARRIYADDVLSFNPWHALAAHRPLGNIMRARKAAYEASTAFRHAMNLTPRTEPQDISELPD